MAIYPDERSDLAGAGRQSLAIDRPGAGGRYAGGLRDFIRGSYAEIGVAKSGYALSRCGWFSDRSVCYLASGRPVVAQETGFSRLVPTGEGLLAFSGVDEAVAAVEAVCGDYARHARHARLLAEEYFDSANVLSRLLDCLGVGR